MVLTRGGDSRQRDAGQEAPEEEKLERASSACSRAGGVKVAARNRLVEPRSARKEGTWNILVAKLPSEDHATVSAGAVDAELARATEGEDANASPWRPDDEYDPRCSSTSSAPAEPFQAPETTVNDLLTFNPSSTPTSGRRLRKGHANLLAENGRRTRRVPARVLADLLAVEPHRIRGKVLICMGMTWRRLIIAEAYC